MVPTDLRVDHHAGVFIVGLDIQLTRKILAVAHLCESFFAADHQPVILEINVAERNLGHLDAYTRSFLLQVNHVKIAQELIVDRGQDALLVLLVVDDVKDRRRIPFDLLLVLEVLLFHQELDGHIVFLGFLAFHHFDRVGNCLVRT